MPVLEVEGLRKHYGSTVAVDGVSFRVERGAVYGLLGQNGSGKTTTLACVLGLMRASSGRIELLGEEPRHIHRTAGRVGVVFDEPILVRGLRVHEQLAYARRLFGHAGGRSLDEALELVGLTALAGRRVTQLSLGERKRLAVASALAGRPELLVLDEPLSGLDPIGARDLLRLFRRLAAEGLTIVVSSHRLNDFEPVLSHAAILVAGRLAAEGSLGALLGAGGRFRLTVDAPERASALLARLPGVAVEHEGTGDELHVTAPGVDPATLNRALVEAGVGVRALRPAERSLAALFESLAETGRASTGTEGAA